MKFKKAWLTNPFFVGTIFLILSGISGTIFKIPVFSSIKIGFQFIFDIIVIFLLLELKITSGPIINVPGVKKYIIMNKWMISKM